MRVCNILAAYLRTLQMNDDAKTRFKLPVTATQAPSTPFVSFHAAVAAVAAVETIPNSPSPDPSPRSSYSFRPDANDKGARLSFRSNHAREMTGALLHIISFLEVCPSCQGTSQSAIIYPM